MAQSFVKQKRAYLQQLADADLVRHYVLAYLRPNRALMQVYLQQFADDFLYPLAWWLKRQRWWHHVHTAAGKVAAASDATAASQYIGATTRSARPESPVDFHIRFSRLLHALLLERLVPHIDDTTHGLLPCEQQGHKMYSMRDGFWLLLVVRELSARAPRLFTTRNRQSGRLKDYHGPDEMLRAGSCIRERLLLIVHLFMGYLLHVLRAGCSTGQVHLLLGEWALAVCMLLEDGLTQSFLLPNTSAYAGLTTILSILLVDAPNRGRTTLDRLARLVNRWHQPGAAASDTHHQCLVCDQYRGVVLGYIRFPPPGTGMSSSSSSSSPSLSSLAATTRVGVPSAASKGWLEQQRQQQQRSHHANQTTLVQYYQRRLQELKKKRDEQWLDWLFEKPVG